MAKQASLFNLCSGNRNRFNANASSTYRANGANFLIRYGDGSYAGGHYSVETVSVSQFCLQTVI
jgi:hypothetical protein